MNLGDLFNLTAQIEGMEWIILLIVIAVLFLFGPSKLPELARSTGRALGEFRRGRLEVEREIEHQFSGASISAHTPEERAAIALGLPTAGRSGIQLKFDIARSLDRIPDGALAVAAQALGIPAASPASLLRDEILKALNA